VLEIILPVGFHFTFHGPSYVIDVYKNDWFQSKTLYTYALFVLAFPWLLGQLSETLIYYNPTQKKKEISYQQ
jgi:hypothetical protein